MDAEQLNKIAARKNVVRLRAIVTELKAIEDEHKLRGLPTARSVIGLAIMRLEEQT